jgi:uncharacterized protein YjbI with pentapeptide repeats
MVDPSPAPTSIDDTRAMLTDASVSHDVRVARWDAMRNINPTWVPVLSSSSNPWECTVPNLQGMDLSGSDLTGATLSKSNLSHACLTRANLDHATLRNVNITGVDCSTVSITDSFSLTHSVATSARFDTLAADSANFSGTTAGHASFKHCCFTYSDFTALIAPHTDFSNAVLKDSNFAGADLSHANFHHADLRRCFLEDVNVSRASFIRTRGLWGEQRAHLHNVRNAEWAIYHPASDFLNWARLRFISTLRLFGVSYVAFFAILLYGGFARWQQEILSALLAHSSPGTDAHAAFQFLNAMPHVPFSPALGGQLVALLLLAIGSTVYAIACPALIQENSETRWSRELHNPVIEYRAALWSRPWARYICTVFYVLGAAYTLLYIGSRFVRVVAFAINS